MARELTENMDIPEDSFEGGSEDGNFQIVNLIVKVHCSVRSLNKQLQKNATRFNYLTPRDFIDFIRHLVSLHKEKQEVLVEQQTHLNEGLNQLKKTEEQVKILDEGLQVKREELRVSNEEAQSTMESMLKKQEEAEEKKKFLNEAQKEIAKKQVEIEERQKVVQNDLSKAGPALTAAQEAVDLIKKKDIQYMKSLPRPPKLIKLTLEALCLVLTGKVLDWK